MNILGIDTSFLSDTSIGLSFSSNSRLEMHIRDPLSQEEKLLFAVNSGLAVLKKTIGDIDTIAVGTGPGSFTGLRIGIAIAKSISWTLKKRIVGLSSLELLVNSIPGELFAGKPLIVPLIDARLNRVFTALFESNSMLTRLSADQDVEPAVLINQIKKRKNNMVIFLGDGLVKYHHLFNKIPGKQCFLLHNAIIRGMTICDMAGKIPEAPGDFDPDRINPVYLRKSEAEIQRESSLR